MPVHPYDIAVLLVYLIALFVIGLYCAKLIKTQKDLFLGGRRFGKVMLAFQSFGIGTHSEQVVAVVGKCYSLGLAGIWWQFLWLFPTPLYWLSHPLLRRMRMVTTADYWTERFSPRLGLVAAFLGLFQVTFTIATMLKAMSTVLQAILSEPGVTDLARLQMIEAIVIPVCAVLFVFYGIAGGLYAATITDLIQGVLTIFLSLLLIPFILMKTGGMSGLHELVPAEKFSYVIPGEMTIFYIVMLSLNGLVGIYTGPHTMTNLGSGRNEWDVRVGTMAGTLMKRFCTVGWAFLGIGAVALYPTLTHDEYAFGYLIRDLLPPGLTGLMVAAILAAVMSTCDAMMLSGSALFTHNLYRHVKPDQPEAHYLKVGRLASACIVIVAAVLAFMLEDVLSGLKAVWSFYAFMGLAWWGGVLWTKTTTTAAWVSTIVTTAAYLGTVIWNQVHKDQEAALSYPEQIAIYLTCGLIALIVTSKLTRHTSPEKVARFYRKMRTPTTQRSEFDSED